MKATTCQRNLLPTIKPSLSFRLYSNSAFSVVHHSNNKTKSLRSIVSATVEPSFKSDKARVPPALPLPTPPVTKIHLFDIDIPGKMTFKESRTLTAGGRPTIVDTEVGRIGVGICYEIRFQELAAIYAARGAHLLCYPGAFNMTTGPMHWELLQRARAADCQLYVATCSPARDSGSGYVAWGHSTLVGPFGEVLVTTEHEETTLTAEIDYSVIEQRRTYPISKTKARRFVPVS